MLANAAAHVCTIFLEFEKKYFYWLGTILHSPILSNIVPHTKIISSCTSSCAFLSEIAATDWVLHKTIQPLITLHCWSQDLLACPHPHTLNVIQIPSILELLAVPNNHCCKMWGDVLHPPSVHSCPFPTLFVYALSSFLFLNHALTLSHSIILTFMQAQNYRVLPCRGGWWQFKLQDII